MRRILILDDTVQHRNFFKHWFDGMWGCEWWFDPAPPLPPDSRLLEFDAVICDFWLGGVDGAQAMAEFVARNPQANAAIISNADRDIIDTDLPVIDKNQNPLDVESDIHALLTYWGLVDA